jgi:hypothetical protein
VVSLFLLLSETTTNTDKQQQRNPLLAGLSSFHSLTHDETKRVAEKKKHKSDRRNF